MSGILAYWVHDLSPFLIQFSDRFGIRYYGLAYVLGFLGGAWILREFARRGRSPLPAAAVGDLMVALVIGVFVGGRVGYFLFYQPETLLHRPLDFFKVWEGGMASHGGFLGVAVALIWFGRTRRLPFRHLGDLVAAAAPLGLLLGRIANFINGELWGKITTFRWAVIFPDSAPPGTPISEIPPRHASQLYEAALEGALMLAYCQWRAWRTPVLREQPGRLAGEFLLGYAVVRMFGELFREPDEGISLIFGLSRGSFYSVFLIAAGLVLILRPSRALAAAPDRAQRRG